MFGGYTEFMISIHTHFKKQGAVYTPNTLQHPVLVFWFVDRFFHLYGYEDCMGTSLLGEEIVRLVPALKADT